MQQVIERNGVTRHDHQHDDPPPEQFHLATRQQLEIAQLSERDRALLTPDVFARWTDGLLPGDVDVAEIVRLERGRQQTLQTIREGVELTDTEFKLLRYFQKHERQTRTYVQIAHHLWGTSQRPITARSLLSTQGTSNSYMRHIWTLISAIRKKLEIDPLRPQHLATIRSVGYRWYNAPPSRTDGEDYVSRATEAERLRIDLRIQQGRELPTPASQALPSTTQTASRIQLGPNHPDYQPIEGDVTQRQSRRDDHTP